ncbi:MAG: hypothetical protein QNJ32_21105 [Xenococcaceae cyanobacterium MO_167.B27]|nr:hypothetical protein [Xenococcaceae cyanobacterium MO_167.B27]
MKTDNLLPLNPSETLKLLKNSTLSDAVKGNFLCFLMIPIVERFGQWRFAGTASNLTEAFNRIGNLIILLGGSQESQEQILEEMVLDQDLEYIQYPQDSWSLGDILERNLGNVNLILLAEGQAPYDHSGFCILEVPSRSDPKQ